MDKPAETSKTFPRHLSWCVAFCGLTINGLTVIYTCTWASKSQKIKTRTCHQIFCRLDTNMRSFFWTSNMGGSAQTKICLFGRHFLHIRTICIVDSLYFHDNSLSHPFWCWMWPQRPTQSGPSPPISPSCLPQMSPSILNPSVAPRLHHPPGCRGPRVWRCRRLTCW